MWKDRRPAGHDPHKAVSEVSIDRRDQTIRQLIDELVDGTKELKRLYGKGDDDNPRN